MPPDPVPMMQAFDHLSARMSLLQAGTLLAPTMPEQGAARFGRIVAAQLAALAIRGHIGLHVGSDEFVGPTSLRAVLLPGVPEPAAEEERLLLRHLFGNGYSVRIAACTDGPGWDRLGKTVRRELAANGFGWARPERYRVLATMFRLRRRMVDHAARQPAWRDNEPLHRSGYPFAVLFGIDTGPGPYWPGPESEADVSLSLPWALPQACAHAVRHSGEIAYSTRSSGVAAQLAEIEQLLMAMDAHAQEVRCHHVLEAERLARLIDDYRWRYSTQTLATAPRPEVLHAALLDLVRETESVRAQLPLGGAAHDEAVLVSMYAVRLADLVLDRTP
ncbi:hypothetical protein [Nocardia veterana]|uniref:Uncharacterized protein n=1 Tax=Nocardia veterana TaxID=132249 RepID=A0A7X6RLD9_9NOCA|nr:hypothetical protein [Nocardia veterana]NKY89663.1 hypothetical protein [Nocardia veterana]